MKKLITDKNFTDKVPVKIMSSKFYSLYAESVGDSAKDHYFLRFHNNSSSMFEIIFLSMNIFKTFFFWALELKKNKKRWEKP